MAYTPVSKTGDRKVVWVRLPPPAPKLMTVVMFRGRRSQIYADE